MGTLERKPRIELGFGASNDRRRASHSEGQAAHFADLEMKGRRTIIRALLNVSEQLDEVPQGLDLSLAHINVHHGRRQADREQSFSQVRRMELFDVLFELV